MRLLRLIVLALLLLLPAGRAGAAVRLHVPEGVTVVPGEVIELRWEGLAPGVREVEFELSLDGGRWVRISPELEVLEGRWSWRVPAQASRDARIRLRCGGEHREEVAATGAPFAIAAGERGEHAHDYLGEWWPALDRTVRHAAPIGLRSGEAPVLAAALAETPAEVPTPLAFARPRDPGAVRFAGAFAGVSAPALGTRPARPLFVPLRN